MIAKNMTHLFLYIFPYVNKWSKQDLYILSVSALIVDTKIFEGICSKNFGILKFLYAKKGSSNFTAVPARLFLAVGVLQTVKNR